MSRDSTLESRLKKIRKELSLIDKDLKNLTDAASGPAPGGSMPRIKSKELREREERRRATDARQPSVGGVDRSAKPAKPAKRKPVLQPQGTAQTDSDGRFVEYLSSSFGSGEPLGQERRIQRNKAILMLVIVLFILFLVLYRLIV